MGIKSCLIKAQFRILFCAFRLSLITSLLLFGLSSSSFAKNRSEDPKGFLTTIHNPDCPDIEQQTQNIERNSGGVARGVQNLLKKWLVLEPEAQLQPGDILIYPFHQQKENPADPQRPARVSIEPDAYKAALEGYGHAAIVARDPKGRLYHLDAPQGPPKLAYEFRGDRPYYVVRPKTPQGLTREQFEEQINKASAYFRQMGYEYDPLMKMDFSSPAAMKKLRAQIEKGIPTEFSGKSTIPPQFCSELTQTILTLAGAKPAKPTTADRMLEQAIEQVKRELNGKEIEGKALEAAAERAVEEVINLFTFGVGQTAKKMETRKKILEEQIKKVTNNEELKTLNEELEWIKKDTTEMRRELINFNLAKNMLNLLVKEKLKGKEKNKIAEAVLKTEVTRPVDILLSSLSGSENYQLKGWYPGHLTACIKMDGRGPGANLDIQSQNQFQAQPNH